MSSGGRFSFNDNDYNYTNTNVRAHLCFLAVWTLHALQKITFLIRVLVLFFENTPY